MASRAESVGVKIAGRIRGSATLLLPTVLLILSSSSVGQITAPRATSVRMTSLPAVEVHRDCLKVKGKLKPPGCAFDPDKALTARGVVGDTARLHQLDFPKGVFSPRHNHADEEIFYIVSGRFRVITGEDEFLLGPGDVLTVPAFVEHEFEALTDATLLETGGPGPMLGKMAADGPQGAKPQ
ncbi:MAG: cupin domain-containing protein [Pseudomonadota bacterium]